MYLNNNLHKDMWGIAPHIEHLLLLETPCVVLKTMTKTDLFTAIEHSITIYGIVGMTFILEHTPC
jgi:hypothetical protein